MPKPLAFGRLLANAAAAAFPIKDNHAVHRLEEVLNIMIETKKTEALLHTALLFEVNI